MFFFFVYLLNYIGFFIGPIGPIDLIGLIGLIGPIFWQRAQKKEPDEVLT